eukprot:gene19789-25313_t
MRHPLVTQWRNDQRAGGCAPLAGSGRSKGTNPAMNSWASDFLLFATVGFFAQIVDGALGMGYGIIASTVLLATGVAPAHTSASVNGSKIFTSAASGLSHIYNGNVDRRLLVILSIAGAIGGVLGAMLLISVPPGATRPYMFGYLFLM